jgi:hypothetical protein
MDDDFDTAGALAVLSRLSERLSTLGKVRLDKRSKESAEQAFKRMAEVIGILS